MIIQPLYAVPQHAEQVSRWLWQEFGEGLSAAFFASVINHSMTPGALPVTFVATDGDRLIGTVGLWRCDLITRWRRCTLMNPREGAGWRANFSGT